MLLIPPFALLDRWLARSAADSAVLLNFHYDDVLEVLSRLLLGVAVDETWYRAEYPAVLEFVALSPDETVSSHFRRHGYFEGRKPFADRWLGRRAPPPFAALKVKMRLSIKRGHLDVRIERDAFMEFVGQILGAMSVDEAWYRSTYTDSAQSIDSGNFASAAEHFANRGYFDGLLPFDIDVDEDWYATRYSDVRDAMAAGLATSAKDHFIRIGYRQGCRPIPPP